MSALAQTKRAYARALRTVGSGLTAIHALPRAAPPLDHRWRHWAYALTRVHDVSALAELDLPWWTYRAVDAVESWLAARPHPIRIFEYGSGASTLWLARRGDEVHSVEHDRRFAEFLRPLLAGAADVDLRVVEPTPSEHPVVSSQKDGQAGLDFAGYVAAIGDVRGSFDLIVIDGRARADCLRAALPRLSTDGLIVFDNSRRRRYRAAIESCGLTEIRLRGLTPTLPYPEQTSLLTARPSSAPSIPR
jgi:predicted O-methyltransferase YrrM